MFCPVTYVLAGDARKRAQVSSSGLDLFCVCDVTGERKNLYAIFFCNRFSVFFEQIHSACKEYKVGSLIGKCLCHLKSEAGRCACYNGYLAT